MSVDGAGLDDAAGREEAGCDDEAGDEAAPDEAAPGAAVLTSSGSSLSVPGAGDDETGASGLDALACDAASFCAGTARSAPVPATSSRPSASALSFACNFIEYLQKAFVTAT